MLDIQKGTSKFFIGDNEEDPQAEITYIDSGEDKIIIDHTIVSESLQGQGIAKKLLEKAVSFARDNNKKIIPVCPYVKAQFEKNSSEYEDVWVK